MSHKYKSLFDIIGPVMVGPSSSHTAGAVRIGNMALDIFGGIPERINIYLFESFAETYQGHGTDVALIGGLLGMKPDDERLHQSLLLAKEHGLEFKFIPLADKVDHPNTAKFVMRKGQKRMDVTGVSIGGGSALITEIDHHTLEIQSGVMTLVISHRDVKGAIAKVSEALVEDDINIATMKVWRESRGENAYMVIEMDEQVGHCDFKKLLDYEFIEDVIVIGCGKHEFN